MISKRRLLIAALFFATVVAGIYVAYRMWPSERPSPAGVRTQHAEPPPVDELRIPAGFKARTGTAAEPYTNTGWAREIVHEATAMEMVFIPAGSFQMGSKKLKQEKATQELNSLGVPVDLSDEGPQHEVKITNPFYMGRYEVTQDEWQKVMGNNPSHFKGSPRLPVDSVSWNDCQAFCQKIGSGMRLPTEAEWEYACRAGTNTWFSFGDDEAGMNACGWYSENSAEKTHEVGSKKPNGWGLCDMHGNLWEWCSDWYSEGYRQELQSNDPTGPTKGRSRVFRGGCWNFSPSMCRSAIRFRYTPDFGNYYVGFRVVVSVGTGR